MKKLLYLFCTTLLVLTSCSSDDDNSSSTNLVKKIIYSHDGQIYRSRTFTYEGNKIVSEVAMDGSKTNYTYTGDVITKIEELNGEGIVRSITEYNYTSGKLATSLKISYGHDEKSVYTYNSDGTVSCDIFWLDSETGTLINNTLKEEKYIYSAGNLVKILSKLDGGKESDVTYEYDSKNNPFKNITGYDLLLNYFETEELSTNNATKIIFYFDITITNIYTYNANGFPTEQKRFYDGDANVNRVTKYIY